MSNVAVAVFLILAVIAGLHVAWGFGLRWPARDERSLVALVIGATDHTRMPSMAQCLLAAAAIFAAGLVALALVRVVPVPADLASVAGALAAVIFAGRGAAAYVPAWRQRFSQQPFAAMDRTYYGPLCLLLALAFAGLTMAS